MAMHILNGSRETGETWIPLGASSEYRLHQGYLTVRRYGETVFHEQVENNTVWEVHCTQRYTKVIPFALPENPLALMLKLVGVPRDASKSSMEGYCYAVEEYNKRTPQETLGQICEIKGLEWAIYWTQKRKFGAQKYYVAARIGNKVPPKEVLLLVPLMLDEGLPLWFLQDILQSRLGITEEISQKAIMDQIPQMIKAGYPVDYLRKVMLKSLGVSEEDFELALKGAQNTRA